MPKNWQRFYNLILCVTSANCASNYAIILTGIVIFYNYKPRFIRSSAIVSSLQKAYRGSRTVIVQLIFQPPLSRIYYGYYASHTFDSYMFYDLRRIRPRLHIVGWTIRKRCDYGSARKKVQFPSRATRFFIELLRR